MRPAFIDLVRLLTVDLRKSHGTSPSVVHLLPTMGWGGAERLAWTFHRLALAHGWTSRVDAPSIPSVDQGLAAEMGISSGNSRENESSLHQWALAARERIRIERPSIVHAHLPFPDRMGMALLAARGRPLVATLQLLPEPSRSWSPDELIFERSDRILAILARRPGRMRLVGVSQGDIRRLVPLVPRGRLVHIANAPPFARPIVSAPPKIHWPAGVVRLLSAGRLHRQKGFDRVMTALSHASLTQLDWHWVIAGDGPEQESLRALIASHGLTHRVSLALDHPASAIYPEAHLVLSPSRWEGMPLVPMEAVEAHRAVVVSDIEPHRELFQHVPESIFPHEESDWPNFLAALISSASSREALASAQHQALPADPRGKMWEAYEALYHQLARE